MKKIIFLFFTLILVIGCTQEQSPDNELGEDNSELKDSEIPPEFNIDAKHVVCANDLDCVLINTHCGNCDLIGKTLNKKYREMYLKIFQTRCKDYDGEICEAPHKKYELKCENRMCNIIYEADVVCEKDGTNNQLELETARKIARESNCVAEANLKGTYMCNSVTGTWWLDLDLHKEGCSPACVVDVETKKAEINWRCTGLIPPEEDKTIEPQEDFCGTSTKGECKQDSDCITSGCSSQICQSISDEEMITTCEFRGCYNSKNYELNCGCVSGQCQWS